MVSYCMRERGREAGGEREGDGKGKRGREGKSNCVQYTIKELSLNHGSHVRKCTVVNWDPVTGSNAKILLCLCQLGFQTIHT